MSKQTMPRCARCDATIKIICENPGANKMLKPKFEHTKDLDTYETEIFFLHQAFPARSTFYKLRRELAARCPYEAK